MNDPFRNLQNVTDFQNAFNLGSSITVSILAIIGNSGVILILQKNIFRKQPLFRYLIIGTIFNTFNSFTIWPSIYKDFFLINEIDISCKLYYYLSNLFASYTPFINTLITIDTLMMVKYPTRFQFRKTFKYQIIILLILLFVSFLVNLPWIFYLHSVNGNCVFGIDTDEILMAFYLSIYTFTVTEIVPCIIIILVSGITFFHLRKKQINFSPKNYKKSKSLFTITLVLNLTFIFTKVPTYVVRAVAFKLSTSLSPGIYNFLILLQNVYSSSDFFIYFASNRLFREACLSFFKCSK